MFRSTESVKIVKRKVFVLTSTDQDLARAYLVRQTTIISLDNEKTAGLPILAQLMMF